MLQFPHLGRNCNIFHFVTTRHGGVSVGSFDSFNLGEFTEDDPVAWQENCSVFCKETGITQSQLIVPFQTHQDYILDIDNAFLSLSQEERKKQQEGVDALVTAIPGICVAVTTADCVPVLIYSPDKKVVASVHAGWRGTVENITGKTVRYMVERYRCDPVQLQVGIGPSISLDAFEVGKEVADAFSSLSESMVNVSYIHPVTGKTHLDLSRINMNQACEEGVWAENVVQSGLCTFQRDDLFFSARRQGVRSGRMLTGIMIKV